MRRTVSLKTKKTLQCYIKHFWSTVYSTGNGADWAHASNELNMHIDYAYSNNLDNIANIILNLVFNNLGAFDIKSINEVPDGMQSCRIIMNSA